MNNEKLRNILIKKYESDNKTALTINDGGLLKNDYYLYVNQCEEFKINYNNRFKTR